MTAGVKVKLFPVKGWGFRQMFRHLPGLCWRGSKENTERSLRSLTENARGHGVAASWVEPRANQLRASTAKLASQCSPM